MATNKRRRVDDDENNATAAANGPPGAPTTPATTNSGGTPGLKGSKPGDSSGSEEGTLNGEKRNDGSGAANKKRKLAWSAEAMALGYETGTIKNSAYVLLAQSGATGMTVAAIVDAATKRGYVWFWIGCPFPWPLATRHSPLATRSTSTSSAFGVSFPKRKIARLLHRRL
jgi:hypothetical protein